MRLYIDSGKHITRRTSERKNNINNALDSPEAVFVEQSPEGLQLIPYIKALLIAPLMVIVMTFWAYIIIPVFQRIIGGDYEIIQHVEDECDAERIYCDESPLEIVSSNPTLQLIGNWVSLVAIMVTGIRNEISILGTLGMLSITGVILFLAFLYAVHERRNITISENIIDEAPEYTECCLVTGKKHQEAIGAKLKGESEVEVLNPKPDSN